MKLDIYQVDAFADRLFAGNPAAVCPLSEWLTDEMMQAIAAENNLSETAFLVTENGSYAIRWFTPVTEVNLCGHATLASAYVVFNYLEPGRDTVTFTSRSGPLPVTSDNGSIVLDFPAQPPVPVAIPPTLADALHTTPLECLAFEDLIVILADEQQVRDLRPDLELLRALEYRGVIVSAAATSVDFVARFFAPRAGIAEDPVTGSAYTRLMPYWVKKFNRTRLQARQVSARGGELNCELKGDRVLIGGKVVPYLKGVIEI